MNVNCIYVVLYLYLRLNYLVSLEDLFWRQIEGLLRKVESCKAGFTYGVLKLIPDMAGTKPNKLQVATMKQITSYIWKYFLF